MLKFNAADFYKVTTQMQHTLTGIEAGSFVSSATSKGGTKISIPISHPSVVTALIERGEELKKSLHVLGAQITIMAVDEMNASLANTYVTYETIANGYKDINHTLRRELTQVTLLSLSADDRKWFEPPEPLFGGDFEWMYPSGVFELDEAAKCLALGRPTAAVFHLMRIMEIGIRAIARCLQIPDPLKPAERNWGVVIKEVRTGIDKKWPTAADRMVGDGDLFEALLASLDAVKNPWRNATMHVENKYTDDEAKHIFVAVEGFMKKLVARMDEGGNPKV